MVVLTDFELFDNWTAENFASAKLLGQIIDEIKYTYRVEFTLCHPHTKPWLKASDEYRKSIYELFYNGVLMRFYGKIVSNRIVYEDTGDHLHAHGYFDFWTKFQPHECGLVCDVADVWLHLLPKRYDHPLKGNCYDNYDAKTQRICIPQCCIQYRFNNPERIEYWDNYIEKNAPK